MATTILNKETAYKKIRRMAFEIVERNMDESEIIIFGIKENGVLIAEILHQYLSEIFQGKITVHTLSIDKKNPKQISLSTQNSMDNKTIILVDDVVNSGKTLLYAMRPFLDFYPKKIQTLVLVERSYKEFPISPDYIGMSVATALSERIVVETNGNEIMGADLM